MNRAADSSEAILNPARLAQDHPWLFVSGALTMGFVLGSAVRVSHGAGDVTPYAPPKADPTGVMPNEEHEPNLRDGVYPYYPHAIRKSSESGFSFMSELGTSLSKELEQVKSDLLAIASDTLYHFVREAVRAVSASAIGLTRHERGRHARGPSRMGNADGTVDE